MKKYAAPLTLVLACIAYGLVVVCAFYFAAQAQVATDVCNTDCLMQKIDALNQKSEALKHTVSELTLEINKSIKTGQLVTLHTRAGRAVQAVHGNVGCRTNTGGRPQGPTADNYTLSLAPYLFSRFIGEPRI